VLSTLAGNHTSSRFGVGALFCLLDRSDPPFGHGAVGLAVARFPAPMRFYEFDAHILVCATREG